MKLMMLFGKEIIDIININKAQLAPDHLLNAKETLIVRNEESLNAATDEPQFALKTTSAKADHNSDYVLV